MENEAKKTDEEFDPTAVSTEMIRRLFQTVGFKPMCEQCLHKMVCKNYDVQINECENFLTEKIDMTKPYAIYDYLEPIYKWMEYHYRSSEPMLIVDHNSARLVLNPQLMLSKQFKGGLLPEKPSEQCDCKST